MAKWVEIDWDELNHPRQEEINGVEVTVYFSPYDMPEAAKGEYDTTKQRFVIRFRYLGGEEPIEYRKGDGCDGDIELGIGKKTQRLHEILVNVERLKANFVALQMCSQPSAPQNLEREVAEKVKRAIGGLASRSTTTTTPAPIENYEAASGALEQQRDQVYSDLAAVVS